MDPNGWGKDENGNYNLDIYQVIENLEQEYANAPEEKILEEVKPQFGLEEDDGMGGTYINEDNFIGVAVTEDGTPFRYILKSSGSTPMSVKIENNKNTNRVNRQMHYFSGTVMTAFPQIMIFIWRSRFLQRKKWKQRLVYPLRRQKL